MTETECADLLMAAIDDYNANNGNEHYGDVRARTFEDASLLTDDTGLVLRIGRAEFQITIVQTRTR